MPPCPASAQGRTPAEILEESGVFTYFWLPEPAAQRPLSAACLPVQLQPIVDFTGLFIGHDAQNKWLYVDWKGEHNPESSRAACLLMLEALRAWPCQKILNNNSTITRTTIEPTQWSLWWLEEMLPAGLECIAWGLPPDWFARPATKATMLTIERPRMGTFDNAASAYEWLQRRQQPVKT